MKQLSRMHFKIRHAYTPSIQGERAFQLLPPTSGLSKHHPLRQPSTQNAGRSNMLNSRASTGQSWRRRSFGPFPQLFAHGTVAVSQIRKHVLRNAIFSARRAELPRNTGTKSTDTATWTMRRPPARPPAHTHEHARTSTHALNPFPAMVPTLAHSLSLNRH